MLMNLISVTWTWLLLSLAFLKRSLDIIFTLYFIFSNFTILQQFSYWTINLISHSQKHQISALLSRASIFGSLFSGTSQYWSCCEGGVAYCRDVRCCVHPSVWHHGSRTNSTPSANVDTLYCTSEVMIFVAWGPYYVCWWCLVASEECMKIYTQEVSFESPFPLWTITKIINILLENVIHVKKSTHQRKTSTCVVVVSITTVSFTSNVHHF